MLFFFTNFHSYFPLFIRFHPAFDKDKIMKSENEKILNPLYLKEKWAIWKREEEKRMGFKKGKRENKEENWIWKMMDLDGTG